MLHAPTNPAALRFHQWVVRVLLCILLLIHNTNTWTVEPCITVTLLMRSPHCYSLSFSVPEKCIIIHFLTRKPCWHGHPMNTTNSHVLKIPTCIILYTITLLIQPLKSAMFIFLWIIMYVLIEVSILVKLWIAFKEQLFKSAFAIHLSGRHEVWPHLLNTVTPLKPNFHGPLVTALTGFHCSLLYFWN